MRRFLLLAGCALTLVALAPSRARAEDYGIEFVPSKGVLGVAGGKVYRVVAPGGGIDWELSLGGTTTIRVRQRKGGRGWYLAYDPDAGDKTKDHFPFLAKKSGPGTRWRVSKAKRAGYYTIRAAEGRLEGWYLDGGGPAEELYNDKGDRYQAFPVKLSEKPGESTLSIFPIGK